ncbi:DHA2 family efflux MFS transporter permease subunit [Amycolatopsis rubida]|uniref:DHA2 family efflux MFS transporter permease subunit n=1 Tax=Amycolatopsis rubida TaxID=112413 RepID=A0ABX0C9D6_9PSEU|nr:DHA2 family efflux MFS transporter permease subunit [Amycolatopsis sp. M39]MYW97958.1 DHA2 family efflux MFS transporter permease subunit [Amycolatopsis rubida]NEC62943.1 DHA2 family efflux MFS transporter permease subunit [Amycolatopsis rubida]OAP22611.1 putative transport protein HsrA [Amycolatopsis sp. M39]
MRSLLRAKPDPAQRLDPLDPKLIRTALVLMLGAFAAMLDTTVVTVALDTLERHFGSSVATMQWVSTGYLLSLSMVIPLTGWAVGRFGAKRMWLTALGLFLLGSVLCGAAWSIESLIVFRVLQGAGGGMLLPLVRTILAPMAGQSRMGRVMVFVAVPGSFAPVLGPAVGGLAVSALSWRWAFFVNVPICVVGLTLAWRMLSDSDRPPRVPLDLLGLFLLSVGLAAVVYGLSVASNDGDFASPQALFPVVAGALLLVAYAVHALKTRRPPIIDVRLFRLRSFASSSTLLFFLGMSLFGSMLLLPLYYQQVHGASAVEAGLLVAPQGLGIGVSSFCVGRLIDRTGAVRAVVLGGMLLAAIGTVPYALAGPHTNESLLIAAQFVGGVGLGAVPLAAITATYRDVEKDDMAAATSASRILQQVGGSLGTAVLAIVLQTQVTLHGAVDQAFRTAFWWALALALLALVPPLFLPGRREWNRAAVSR